MTGFRFDVGCPDCYDPSSGAAELETVTTSRARFGGQAVILRCTECHHEFLVRLDLERIRTWKGQRDHMERSARSRGLLLDRMPYGAGLALPASR